MTDDGARLRRIGELTTIARVVEQRGAYNGAKLLRAALDRELVRWAVDHRPADRSVAERVRAIAAVERSDGDPDLADRLADLARIIDEGGTVTLDDAPEVRTCRICGELFLGPPPRTCPTCESPALTFREQPPTWFLEPIEPATVLAELERGPVELRAALDGLDPGVLERQPRAGEWSVRETLEHLVGAEELLSVRIRRLQEEDEPDLVAWVPWGGAAPSDEATPTTDADAMTLFQRYVALRSASIERLRGLGAAGWLRRGRHPEWGTVTVLSQAGYFIRHQGSHAAQLTAAAEGRVPGEQPAR